MNIGLIGYAAALGLAGFGSAFGAGVAGQAAIGAWKKCFANNKPVPFLLVAFVGAPLTQTIYGFILMNQMIAAIGNGGATMEHLGIGLFGGLAMGASAYAQGRAGAGAADAMGETGKGFVNYLMVLGVIETVALFAMVFLMGAL